MREKCHYPLQNDVMEPMNSFYIPIVDRWLDLYWVNNRVPGVEMSLYWNDTGESYQQNMCAGEVFNIIESMLNPLYTEDIKRQHEV